MQWPSIHNPFSGVFVRIHHFHFLPGDDGEVSIKVLHILPFDATRKRMSVIIEHPVTHQVVLLCKGADSAIFNNLATFQGTLIIFKYWL